MLDAGLRQLRLAWCVATGSRIRVSDAEAIVRHLGASVREFGAIDQRGLQEALGRPVDPDARRAFDERGWRRAVRAAARTPYYRDLFARLDLDPATVRLDDLAAIPLTSKDLLRADCTPFVSERSRPQLLSTTTGTTGRPTSCWFSVYEMRLAAAFAAISMMTAYGISEEDVVHVAVPARSTLAVHLTIDTFHLIGAGARYVGVMDPHDTLVGLMARTGVGRQKPRASVLTTTASQLGALVDAAERAGHGPEDFGLELVLSGGEVLTDHLRARAVAVFGAPVSDVYSLTETFPMSGTTCSQEHLHFSADAGLVEVVDPATGAPVAPGQWGSLVMTPFPPFRETTLVLRYVTGDIARRLDGSQLTCEMAGIPATSRLAGRDAEAAGRRLLQRDLLDLLHADTRLPLPTQYGLVPTGDGVEVHVVGPVSDGLALDLERVAAARSLPVAGVVLHESASSVPNRQFVRALLKDTTVAHDAATGGWRLK
ncbi:phenylacetate--CoA ligase family protein [Intrasporangium sp. YIM S08009]|uniref:phenylacetate--CoA ligase family protein n=1 Tax=Intrasporangium zincisolvens TaxID=3080018 RepID=UPI002B053020|nr:AMP-binding protein [Intrasporangium sp. YIM S08009]